MDISTQNEADNITDYKKYNMIKNMKQDIEMNCQQ